MVPTDTTTYTFIEPKRIKYPQTKLTDKNVHKQPIVADDTQSVSSDGAETINTLIEQNKQTQQKLATKTVMLCIRKKMTQNI